MTFTDIRAAAEYASLYKKDYEDFLATQLPNREEIYQKVGYYNLNKERQNEIDNEINEMCELIKSQYTIYNYPHNWKQRINV